MWTRSLRTVTWWFGWSRPSELQGRLPPGTPKRGRWSSTRQEAINVLEKVSALVSLVRKRMVKYLLHVWEKQVGLLCRHTNN
ncbi:uncharacterized protein BO72DRAFT_33824 [Aspergillus fijiensis CBS 313.89]|uniref:Uncharacterized protein n=1 Tax=Aspergillus fijiensis CBS 313.89 TaxID=1448319 RepID=A0A8G1RXL0_9EURO|nr:uncharacterized protein BO72DRAFT_33824 [Aspergillus fijiensis CBS 313.89]RAK79645.1 hypothetical protein BO72DRAFT_33824 [Aspergillus fijiensis CBS 313.89]